MAGKPRDVDTTVQVVGIRPLLRALSDNDKELQKYVRDASGAIAGDLVTGATQAAHTPGQRLAASGLRVKRDRIPVVRVGTQMVRAGVRATDVFYGYEFGGGKRPTTQQFPAHRGRRGYFFYPTARARGKHYFDLWSDAVDTAFKAWDYKAPKHPAPGA